VTGGAPGATIPARARPAALGERGGEGRTWVASRAQNPPELRAVAGRGGVANRGFPELSVGADMLVSGRSNLARRGESGTIQFPAGPGVMALGLLLLFALIAVVLGTLVLSAWALLHPPRMTDGKATYVLKRLSPSDLGMKWEVCDFQVRDERTGKNIRIAGWWIPHPVSSNRTVVFLHGYADAKVGSIAWAPTWQSLGWNVLAIDLRAQGESGGKSITGGVLESADVDQVINQLRASRPGAAERIAIFGISYGGAVALAVASERDDIDAVVLECPFSRFGNAVRAHAGLMELPLTSLTPWMLRIAEWLAGVKFDSVRPGRTIMTCPSRVMLILAENDPFVSPADAEELRKAVADREKSLPPATIWRVAGTSHLMALPADAREYEKQLGEFLAEV